MKKIILIITLYTTTICLCFSQTITVIDKTSLAPIANVHIDAKAIIGTTTNYLGQGDMSAYKYADSIFFKHIAYSTVCLM